MKGQKRRGKGKGGKKINGERAARALSNEHVDAPRCAAGSTFQLLRVNFYTPNGKIRLGQCCCSASRKNRGTRGGAHFAEWTFGGFKKIGERARVARLRVIPRLETKSHGIKLEPFVMLRNCMPEARGISERLPAARASDH